MMIVFEAMAFTMGVGFFFLCIVGALWPSLVFITTAAQTKWRARHVR